LATLRELGFLMLDQTAIASSGVTGLGDLIACLHICDTVRQPLLPRAGIVVRTEFTTPFPPVLGHTGQPHQVFMNLVKNAAEAMEAVSDRSRVLSVKSEFHDADGVVVSVEDTGTGIDPKHIGRLFDSFFTTKPEGMGMGLSVCRSIIEAHGGRLSASKGAVHGSIFSVKLPASRPAAK
jgi:signal transduction histidine kinase